MIKKIVYILQIISVFSLIQITLNLSIIDQLLFIISHLEPLFMDKTCKPSRLPAFISKMLEILKNQEFNDIIYWDQDLNGIRINNQKKLEQRVLKKYFRHCRFSSFVRQLNMYDFHKVHLPGHKYMFVHQTFNPKNKVALRTIKRKTVMEEKSQQSMISQQENREIVQSLPINHKKRTSLLLRMGIQQLDNENQAYDDIINALKKINNNEDQLKQKIQNLKKNKLYKRFMRKKTFVQRIQQEIKISIQLNQEELSQLSIQDQLMIKSKRSFSNRSLRLLQSGPLYFRDTIGQLLN